jgi:hypothetical protein
MAVLIPYDVKDIFANYSSATKQFTITTTALLPWPFNNGMFNRTDGGKGGRKYRMEGFAGGISGTEASMMDPPCIETMTSPPSFQTISIVLANPKTKTQTTVEVRVSRDTPFPVTPLRPQPLLVFPALSKSDPSALPAINIALPAQNFVRITAPILDSAEFRTTVEGRNDGYASFTWRAGELPDLVYWDVAWTGNGAGVGKGAAFIVTTTVAKNTLPGGVASNASPQITVQPYAIKLPVPKVPIEDRFDSPI